MTDYWRQAVPASSPSARAGVAMCYDEANDKVVLFGGYDGSVSFQDTWLWDGVTWTEVFPAHSPAGNPDPGEINYCGFQNSMCFDQANGNVVLQTNNGKVKAAPHLAGPFLPETWVWDGSDWTQLLPVTNPPALIGQGMCYDQANGYVLMYGGGYTEFPSNPYRNTWKWDGTDWTLLVAGRTGAGTGMGQCFDEMNNQVVQYGGDARDAAHLYHDTWTWNGASWDSEGPADNPGDRRNLFMDYAPSCGKVVMYGGTAVGGGLPGTTWLWDGTNWEQLVVSSGPSARANSGSPEATQGVCRNVSTGGSDLIMFGGYTAPPFTVLDETWLFKCDGFAPVVSNDPYLTAIFSTV